MIVAALGVGGRFRPLPDAAGSCAVLTACASSAGAAGAARFAACAASESISAAAAQTSAVAQALPRRMPIEPEWRFGLWRCPFQIVDGLTPGKARPGTS